MIEISLQKVRDQKFTVTLDKQQCEIRIFNPPFTEQVFIDLTLNNEIIFKGVLVLSGNKIVRDAYHGFKGELVFLDHEGLSDPSYLGFGDRWSLYYLTEEELNS